MKDKSLLIFNLFIFEYLQVSSKILEANSCFHVKQTTTGNVYFLFFRRFLLVLTKCSFRKKDWALGNKTWRFKIFLIFPKIVSLSFGNSSGNLFISAKRKLAQPSKSLKILWKWLPAKFYFTFYVFINSFSC